MKHERLGRESLGSRAAENLRERILDGSIPPGTKLTEVGLAKELDTSRGPVREALRQLAGEGLVKRHASYRSAEVIESSRTEIVEVLLPVRVVVEGFAARLAATSASSDLDSLEAIVDQMRGHAASNDSEAVGQDDLRFHRTLVTLTKMEQCVLIWESIQPRLIAHFRSERTHQSLDTVVQEHESLLVALRSGNPDIAVQTLRDHILSYPGADRHQVT